MKNFITVKQLGKYLSQEIKTDPILRRVKIVGEIKDLSSKYYTYFLLNEDDENLSCVYFGNDFNFKEGDQVVVEGSINLYLRDSRYQLRVESCSLLGKGKDSIQLDKLKIKLQDKGYFDLDKKKNIPLFPEKIGLVSGLESAAYYDFIKVLTTNNYHGKIYYLPALVQGKMAPENIVAALDLLDNMDLDLIVVTRGGGSKNDLSAFNSEALADKIFSLDTPIMTAIGHEIDLSIADMVADIHLQTPTKAGEYIVKNLVQARETIKYLKTNIQNQLFNKYLTSKNLVDNFYHKIELKNPSFLLEKVKNRVNNTKAEISLTINDKLNNSSNRVNDYYKALGDAYNNIIAKNQIYLQDDEGIYLELDKLNVNKTYYLSNSKRKLKIYIEGEVDEWEFWTAFRWIQGYLRKNK